MDKIKIMGFCQPPSTIIFDDPHTQKDVKTITFKRLAQFIGQTTLLYKNLKDVATTLPLEDEG